MVEISIFKSKNQNVEIFLHEILGKRPKLSNLVLVSIINIYIHTSNSGKSPNKPESFVIL